MGISCILHRCYMSHFIYIVIGLLKNASFSTHLQRKIKCVEHSVGRDIVKGLGNFCSEINFRTAERIVVRKKFAIFKNEETRHLQALARDRCRKLISFSSER